MDSMIMAARVALLILVTGTFTAIWSNDRPHAMAEVTRPKKILVGQRSRPEEMRFSSGNLHYKDDGSSSAMSSENLPLPEGITVGNYLVVDPFGRTSLRTVTERADSALRFAVVIPVDHYFVTRGQSKWHYIRIGENVSHELADSVQTLKR